MSDSKFKPGNSGRPLGSRNKSTVNLREKVTEFITKNWEGVQSDFEALEPKDRLAYLERLLNFSIPKLAAVNNSIAFENMTDEQLDTIIEKLKS